MESFEALNRVLTVSDHLDMKTETKQGEIIFKLWVTIISMSFQLTAFNYKQLLDA